MMAMSKLRWKMNLITSKDLVNDLKSKLSMRIDSLISRGINPKLSAIICSSDPAVKSYVASKKKLASELRIGFDVIHIESYLTQEDAEKKIYEISRNGDIGGIVLELPVDAKFNELLLTNAIDPRKDVDGLTATNLGYLMQFSDRNFVTPATPKSCLRLAETITELKGKNVVVVGRGRTVGKPLANLLIGCGATVTVCHSGTRNLKSITSTCDIVFLATGKPKFFDKSYFQSGQIIIDAGIGFIDNKISGDLDLDDISNLDVSATPVPGGVGPLTNIFIFDNLITLIENNYA